MSKTIPYYIIFYSFVLLTGFLFLLFINPFIPKYIPNTPINLSGLLIWVLLTTFIIIALKRIKRIKEDIHLLKLTLIGGSITFFSEFGYQIIRQFTLEEYTIMERLELIFQGVLVMTVCGLAVSFLTSYHLITRKTITTSKRQNGSN